MKDTPKLNHFRPQKGRQRLGRKVNITDYDKQVKENSGEHRVGQQPTPTEVMFAKGRAKFQDCKSGSLVLRSDTSFPCGRPRSRRSAPTANAGSGSGYNLTNAVRTPTFRTRFHYVRRHSVQTTHHDRVPFDKRYWIWNAGFETQNAKLKTPHTTCATRVNRPLSKLPTRV